MCCVPGCDRPTLVKKFDLCENHYRTMRRNGSPTAYVNQPWGQARTLRADGYIYITVDGKQVMEHRYKKEKELGRKLLPNEVVHHKDRNRRNNDLSNLEVMTKGQHTNAHRSELTRANREQYTNRRHLGYIIR